MTNIRQLAPLRCTSCGSTITPVLEYTPMAYSEHRDHTGYECDECPASWDKRGEPTIQPADTASDAVLIRCSSHRARAKLLRITGPLQSYFSWHADGEWYYVPTSLADKALSITGISRARPREDLQRTIKW
jgi:hypothetical protein